MNKILKKITIVAILLSITFTSYVLVAQINEIKNAAIIRRSNGVYRYESMTLPDIRGSENFQMLVHPDRSRTLIMWNDLAVKNTQFTVVLRVSDKFRPIEAFVSYWNQAQFKGSAHLSVINSKLLASSLGPLGVFNRDTDVPENFSIGAHPVSGDGWHTVQYEHSNNTTDLVSNLVDTRQKISLYSLEASSDLKKPVLGNMLDLSIEYLGPESIVVPAGKFETQHYKIGKVNDIWVMGQDRIVVKSEIPMRSLRYVLTEYSDR